MAKYKVNVLEIQGINKKIYTGGEIIDTKNLPVGIPEIMEKEGKISLISKTELKPEPKPKPKPKPKTETAEQKLRRQFDSIKSENKPDQVKTLTKFGLTKKEIRALRYEKDRVNKLLELME